MKRNDAVKKIMSDLSLSSQMEDYVYNKYGFLTDSADSVDIYTVNVIKETIRKELKNM